MANAPYLAGYVYDGLILVNCASIFYPPTGIYFHVCIFMARVRKIHPPVTSLVYSLTVRIIRRAEIEHHITGLIKVRLAHMHLVQFKRDKISQPNKRRFSLSFRGAIFFQDWTTLASNLQPSSILLFLALPAAFESSFVLYEEGSLMVVIKIVDIL